MQDRGCPNKAIDHHLDADMAPHGSKAHPIQIAEPQHSKQIQWEYSYIAGKLPVHHVCGQELLQVDLKMLDRIVARTASGQHHAFYFDVTQKILTEGSELQKAYEKMKKDPNLDPEMKKLIEAEEKREAERKKKEDGKA